MNQGLYGFPNPNDPLLVDIKEFDASGTYRIPDGTKLITFHVIGGGAGGRGGVRSLAGGLGGGGGGGGGTVVHTFLREQIRGSLLEITIGAGGIGGATTTGAQQSGTVGGATSVTVSGAPGVLLRAGGGGIHSTISSNRNPNGVNIFNGVPIQLASTSLTSGMRGGSSSSTTQINITMKAFYAKGGAGGGGSNSSATSGQRAGGDIRTPSSSGTLVSVNNPNRPNGFTMLTGGATGGVAATRNGQSAYEDVAPYWGGMGGAGGGAHNGGGGLPAGNGGNGYRGGGGGGGGILHALSGIAGGGGNGGNGYVAIFCYK